MAQTGSGTEKTWAADIVGGPRRSPVPERRGVSALPPRHSGLFENEVSAMITSRWYLEQRDEANAIYFFSSGKFKRLG